MRRYLLYKGEISRLPAGTRAAQVIAGRAWISVAGKDIILHTGEAADLPHRGEAPVASALGDQPLVIEVKGARHD